MFDDSVRIRDGLILGHQRSPNDANVRLKSLATYLENFHAQPPLHHT